MKSILYLVISFQFTVCTAQSNEAGRYYSLYRKQSPKKLIDKFSLEASFYHLKNHDQVFDLGGNDGSLIIPLSIAADTLDYYLEDIHDNYFPLAAKTLALAKEKTNPKIYYQIHTALGNDTAIFLSAILFDKIFIRETFHHFKYPERILREVRRLLKKDGEVKIIEPIDPKKFPHCHLIPSDRLIKLVTDNGLKYISTDQSTQMVVYTFGK